MGRGRAKAKQTKVARQLKYQTLGTDFEALQRELGGSEAADRPGPAADEQGLDDDGDPYGDPDAGDPYPADSYRPYADDEPEDEPARGRR